MEWIERFTADVKGRLRVVARPLRMGGATSGSEGELRSRVIDFGDFDVSIPKASRSETVRRSVVLDLQSARLVDLQPYLFNSGLGHLSSKGQVGWLFGEGRSTVVVPAQSLLVALLAPLPQLRSLVLTPCGPEHVATSLMEDGRLRPGPGLRPGPVEFLYRRRPRELMEWLSSFRGARAAWSSAYLSALRGQLSITLPNATLDCVALGPTIGRTLVALHLSVHSLETDESPLQVAPNAPAKFTFSEFRNNLRVAVGKRLNKPRADPRVQRLGVVGGLTDAQWDLVQPVLSESVARSRKRFKGTTTPRGVVDAVLRKFSTPCRWEHCADKATASSAQISYRYWKQSGVWQQVLAALESGEHASNSTATSLTRPSSGSTG